MPLSRPTLTGTRIRARRNLRGVRQADLARTVGVSPSFLNLIEHNRRRASPALLDALAEALGVSADALVEGADGRLVEGVRTAAQRSEAELDELERVEEFTGRFPGWARVLAETQARVERLERVVERLNDRMTHDPYIGEALHEIISAVTSVQSTASILTEDASGDTGENGGGSIDPVWRARFHENILHDSTRLADGAVALVNYLDAGKIDETGLAAPLEEVEAWLARQGFHLPEIETGDADPEAMVRGQAELSSDASRTLAAQWIEVFAADARALPLDRLAATLAEAGLAPERIAARLGAPYEQVLRRLALLPDTAREAAGLPEMGLVICDASGTMVFRRPLDGFGVPRFGGGCPLWPLYQALLTPCRPLRQVLLTAGRLGRRFLAHAHAAPLAFGGYGAPQVLNATMLVAPWSGDDGSEGAALGVGASCRTCAQQNCVARREPSILSAEG